MDDITFSLEGYEWLLSVYVFVGLLVIPYFARYLFRLVPVFADMGELNREAAEKQKTRKFYNEIQRRSKFWGFIAQIIVYLFIVPFFITAEAQPWWRIPLDVFIILMFYDFFYYLIHRFLFHDGGLGPGPLIWVHAVHHRMHNPCRYDSAYLHPVETSAGILLYGASIGVLGWLMGDFHVLTILITAIAYSEINLHNHDLQEVDRFPYKYLKYMSFMHHVHHSRFTAGNYATISLFYDWLFGTYDTGKGWGKNKDSDV